MVMSIYTRSKESCESVYQFSARERESALLLVLFIDIMINKIYKIIISRCSCQKRQGASADKLQVKAS